MSKVTIKSIVHKSTSCGEYCLYQVDMSNYGYIVVGPVEFEYEIPADFNPIAAEVAAIEKKLGTMADEYHSSVRNLRERIESLLCIEMSPAA